MCDPACGSGAFLIAANNFLARELAKIRAKNELEPSEKEVRKARREVLQHCIYGVDVNPMAVELAKVSLWINASAENVPLNFLDHHIKCGNSLIGTTPELVEKGIPSAAFSPVTNDDLDIAKRTQKVSNAFPDSARLEDFMVEIAPSVRSQFEQLTDLSESEVLEVEEKKKMYSTLVTSEGYQVQKFIADTWTSAFFWRMQKGLVEAPTTNTIHSIEKTGKTAVDDRQAREIEKLSQEYRFFHWHLEFPEIFSKDSKGFDCMLGNPPWEKVELKEKEFFEVKDPRIANAATGVRRKQMIEELQSSDPSLWNEYQDELRSIELTAKFFRGSGRYPLTARGPN